MDEELTAIEAVSFKPEEIEKLLQEWASRQGCIAKNFRPKIYLREVGEFHPCLVSVFDGYEFDLEKA